MNKRDVPKLTDLHIRLVSKCNLNCKHCYASDWFKLSERLSTDVVCRTIDEAMELGLESVTLTGGEPMLHHDVAAVLEHCIFQERRVKIETNGLLLHKNKNKIRTLIVENKDLVCLHISYDLGKQRGISTKCHDVIKENILDLHTCGVDLRLQSSLTTINIGELDKLTELCREHGIHQRVLMDHSPMGNGVALKSLEFDTIIETFHYLDSLGLNLRMELPPLISGQVSDGCGWGLTRCEIMANGDVTTCAPVTFTQTAFVAGNLRDRTLAEIWSESDYFQGMREIAQSDFLGVCGKCRYWQRCRGSCRAYAWSHGRNWFSPYALCQLYAERYPDTVRPYLTHDDISLPDSGDGLDRLGRIADLASVDTRRV